MKKLDNNNITLVDVKKPKIVFFGSSQRAVQALEKLCIHGFIPHVLVTTNSPEVERWVKGPDNKTITVIQPNKIDTECINFIKAQKPDLGILVSYGKILPDTLLEIFPKGILNLHPSLLPKYRGPTPEQNAIVRGDTATGITIMLIAKKTDAGPIVAQKELVIAHNETLLTLSQKLFELGSNILVEVLPKWIAGEITPIPQDDTKATYTKLLKKEDGAIDWSKSANEIERMVRAYNPWPGTYTILKTSEMLKIKSAEVIAPPLSSPVGSFFKTVDGFPAIVCGKNALKLLIVQPEGKKEMSGKAYLLGHKRSFE